MRTHLTVSVCEMGWDVEFILASLLHQLHSFCPARDDAIERKCSGCTSLHRAVKDFTVNSGAMIMTGNTRAGCRLRAITFYQYFVLQAAFQSHYIGFGFVGF